MAAECNFSSSVGVALVSGPGLGHVNGCIQLALSLADAGFYVSIVCFEQFYRAHTAKGRIKQLSHPSVQLHVLADGISAHSPSYFDLFAVTPTMHQSLENFIATSAPSRPIKCIIADSIMSWTQDVSYKLGIPRVDYWTATASSYLFILGLPEMLARGYIGRKDLNSMSSWLRTVPHSVDCVPGLAEFPADEITKQFRLTDADNDLILHIFLKAASRAKEARSLLVNSMYELEPEAFDVLKQDVGIHAYGIAPLIGKTNSMIPDTSGLLTWLDGQAPGSVIYVAFGSNAILRLDEVAELAHGLEASGQLFVWVIRSDAVAGRELDLEQVLPPGFLTRTAQNGIILSWAPQVAILGHPSVGGFLSHCGWNSTLESLWTGVPMLACPRGAEQPTNCRLMTRHWGTAIRLEVEDPHDAALIRRGQVEAGVRELMTGLAGQKARSNAKKLSEVLRRAVAPSGSSHSNLAQFAMEVKAYI